MILAVAGGKGGVGKTTVSLHLGAALDAVVVDGDLGMADLPTSRGPDLHDVLAGRAAAVEAVREGLPVALLPCGRSLAGARATDPGRLVAVLRAVERAYGSVVVDCPAGMAADVGLALYAADACVLVATPDRLSLPDAIRTRELARELDAGVAAVALNRVGESPPTGRIREALGGPVVPVPDDERIARATDTGRPVGTGDSGAAFVDLADAVRRNRPERS